MVRNESEIKTSQAVGVRHHAGPWVWKGFLWAKQYWIQYTVASLGRQTRLYLYSTDGWEPSLPVLLSFFWTDSAVLKVAIVKK